ncbi:ribonuclease HI [Vaginella massiliensis]|uniref:ribonuclease HI n=1 Tax=Vaginella massiliensis TaxID=1816680 RepID=UPI00083911AB|nr:ribonuclease HI [Vaginella massiliensis]
MAIVAFTDGSSLGNPGPGGFGVILLETEKKIKKEVAQGFRRTTNNRMELLAVIVALELLKKPKSLITIYTDSRYVVDAVEKKWVFGWEKKNFKGKKNEDLWRRFLKVYPLHQVQFIWVKGHAGNIWNERADELAVQASNTPKNFLIDYIFEATESED